MRIRHTFPHIVHRRRIIGIRTDAAEHARIFRVQIIAAANMEADGIFLLHPLRHALVLRISAVWKTDFLPKQRHDIMVIFFTGPVPFQVFILK